MSRGIVIRHSESEWVGLQPDDRVAIRVAGPELLAAGEGPRLRFRRNSLRAFVHAEAGQRVGAGEAFVWDVGPAAVAALNSHGIGKTPDGPVEDEVTGQGVGLWGGRTAPFGQPD